jgi:hypothetical protein
MLNGGSKFTPEIKSKLLANPDERPPAVHAERVKVARYFNKVGPIAHRFLSQLFSNGLQFEGSREKYWQDTFFPGGALLPESDDDGRTGFESLLRSATLQGFGQGKAIVQIDTAPATTTNRKEQRQRREDEPYCLLLNRGDLWDWKSDRNGFRFAKIHRFSWERDTWSSTPVARHDFTIYQRQPDGQIIAYRYVVRREDKDGKAFEKGTPIDLLRESDALKPEIVDGLNGTPIFSHKSEYKFPIVTMAMPPALHLADQLFDPQCSHFNQSAALEYGLLTSNYAMMQIKSSDLQEFRNRNSKFGDGYFIHLEGDETATWLERSGGTFNISKEYRGVVEEEINKSVQQIALAAADAATAASGETLRQARKPEEILLSLYGSMVREFAKNILDVAAIAHAETPDWKVSGMDNFQNIDLNLSGQEFLSVAQAGIPSPTFKKEHAKTFARTVARQEAFGPDIITQIVKEIDDAPDSGNPETEGKPAQGGDEVDQLLGEVG